MTSIEILLATYNGARFLRDLLASLDRQSEQDWTLVVRDDGSTDATLALLAEWAEAHPGRLRLIEDGQKRLGAMANFEALIAASEADYFLLCDQDDCWLPDKIHHLHAAMRAAEVEHGRATPIIVHSDLIVTNDRLEEIAPSFWGYQRLIWPSADAPWRTLALQNVVTGCAMIGNAALRKAALPIPEHALMHDWWLALVAATTGRILHMGTPTTLYRQHGHNTLGAKSWSTPSGFMRMAARPLSEVRRARHILRTTRQQAHSLLERYGGAIKPEARQFLQEYSDLAKSGFFVRKTFPFRHRLLFADAIRTTGLVVLI